MTLEELLQKLKELKRPSDVFGRTEYFPVIDSGHFRDVEVLIRQYALDNHDAEIGVLKAKVYAYEKIIANSNFAPLEQEPKQGHWIPKTQYAAICSTCNHLQGTNGADLTGKALVHKALFKYCPNCGARMSEVEE